MARITIIEDDPLMLNVVSLMLREAGHKTRAFTDAALGVQASVAEPPDAVLCDIGMPKQDGFAVLSALRADARTASVPFIFVSGRDAQENYRSALRGGANDFLRKPIQRAELLGAIDTCLRRPPASAVPQPFPAIEGYKLLRTIGDGGMASVYIAVPEDGGAQCVIKLVPMRRDNDGELVQRFIHEYAIVSQIGHRHVARIHSQGFTGTHAYIVMEYLPGGDLRAHAKGGVAPSFAFEFLSQIGSALDAIHRAGIVHRDLKPENVMVRADGSLALVDFGVARHHGLPADEGPRKGVFGTPFYISPEAAQGRAVDPRGDLYSLGVIFFELLTGRKPYVAADADTLLDMHVQSELPRLPASLAALQPIVDRLMAKDPGRRFSSAREMLDALPVFSALLSAERGCEEALLAASLQSARRFEAAASHI